MSFSLLIIILLSLLSIILFILYLITNNENKKLYNNFMVLKAEIGKKYVNKLDVRIINAAQEAYENAKKNNNEFEIKEYASLLSEIKGKSFK